MRVVLDTNILVSACWKPEGNEARVVYLAREGKLAVYASEPIRAEYASVLARPRFIAVRAHANQLTKWIDLNALLVETDSKVTAARDEEDNRFLECVEAAHAEYLITGNLRHYPTMWATARVVNARQFLESFISPRNCSAKTKV